MRLRYETSLIVFSSMLAMLYLWASDMYLPAFSEMAGDFQTEESAIGYSLSIFFLGLAFSQLVFGSISDQLGRRYLLLIGITIFIAGCMGSYYSNTIEVFILFRVITAVGACSTMVLWQAIVVDSFDGKRAQKLFAIVYMLLGMSPALAPAAGGIITEHSDWRNIFLFLSVYGALLLLFTVFIFKESISPTKINNKIDIRRLANGYRQLLNNRFFMSMSVAVGLLVGLYMAYISLVPFIFSDLGYTAHEIGLSFIPIAISFMIGSRLAVWLQNRMEIDTIIRIGMFSTVAGSAVMILAVTLVPLTNPWQLIAPMTLLTLCNGIAIPFGAARVIQSFEHISGTCSSALGFLMAFIPFVLVTIGSETLPHFGNSALVWILTLSSIAIALANMIANSSTASLELQSDGDNLVFADGAE